MEKKGSISRRNFLGVTGSSLAAGLVPGAAKAAQQETKTGRRPNIILFMPDMTRADGLACYGNPVARTPNMDRLANEGVRFSNCFSQNPICGPSRCSLATGWPVHVRGHRTLYYFLRPDEPNMFRYLRQAGYDVFWYGKNHMLAPACFGDSVTEWGVPDWEMPKGCNPENPWTPDDPRYYSLLANEGCDRRDYPDYARINAAIRILERRDSDKPFVIFLPLTAMLGPYSAPKGFHDLYNPASLPPLRPPGLPGKPDFYAGTRKGYRLGGLQDSDFRKIHATYLAMISYTDWLLGRLLEGIEKTGHANDTAVFLFSDHGNYAGDYGMVEHWPNGMEDVVTHIPLLASVPGMARGHVSNELVELFDVMPTCLELAGTHTQHTHFARSLMPQLRGEAGDPQRAAYAEGGYERYEPQCFEPLNVQRPNNFWYIKASMEIDHPEWVCRTVMLRTADHKLIRRPSGQSEFYDLKEDPRELHNVFHDRAYAGAKEKLQERMLDWYVLTSGVTPPDKDPRDLPPFYRTPNIPRTDWRRKMLG